MKLDDEEVKALDLFVEASFKAIKQLQFWTCVHTILIGGLIACVIYLFTKLK